jgi:hypothetical protein
MKHCLLIKFSQRLIYFTIFIIGISALVVLDKFNNELKSTKKNKQLFYLKCINALVVREDRVSFGTLKAESHQEADF